MTARTALRPKIAWEERLPSRRGVLFALKARYSTRFHMVLIVLASMGVALLVTKGLLAAGLDAMFWRYATALVAAYAAFFIGVWVWLHLSAYGRHLRARRPAGRTSLDAPSEVPVPDVSWPSGSSAGDGFSGGGGSFDGGGASSSWAEAEPLSSGSPLETLNDSGGALDVLDVGDEGGVLLIVAIGLVVLALVVLFGGVGLVLWEAPAILTEVVFEVLLASSLIKGVNRVESRDWSLVLLRQTWKSFAFVCALALGFAWFAGNAAPQAKTAADVVRTLTGE